MPRVIIFVCLALVLIGGCAKEPVKPKLLRSMAQLDQAYIPAFIFTDLHKQREAEIAIQRLRARWDVIYDQYYGLKLEYGINIVDKFWKEDFDKTSAELELAETLIKAKQLSAAHERLVGIRTNLRDLRQRNGLEYFLDGMTGYHDAMENIRLSLRGKDKLRDKDHKQLRSLFKQAQNNWAKLDVTKIEAKNFGFRSKKIEAIRRRVREQEKHLAAFAAALSSKNADLIFQSSQDLRPNFTVLYKAFGDWQPIFDQVIREKKEQARQKEATSEVGSE